MPKFSATALKWIALISMFCDHLAKIVISAGKASSGSSAAMQRFFHSAGIAALHEGLQDFGRIAFVLFAFLLIEGFRHTRSRPRYLIRLLLFALISEIPFDLAFRGKHLDPASGILIEASYQNVLFTLSLGLLAMILAEWIFGKIRNQKPVHVQEIPGEQRRMAAAVLPAAGAVAVCMLAAHFLRCDYRAYGVAAIAAGFAIRILLEHLPGYTARMIRLLSTAAIVIPLILADESELWGFLALLPVCFYDGTRQHDGGGRVGIRPGTERTKKNPARLRGVVQKYIFYLFYPGHLVLLVLLRSLVTG